MSGFPRMLVGGLIGLVVAVALSLAITWAFHPGDGWTVLIGFVLGSLGANGGSLIAFEMEDV